MRFQYGVKGMNCAACVSHVEKAAKRVVGDGDTVTVSLLTNTLCVITQDDTNKERLDELLSSALKGAGYTLVRENLEEKKKSGEYRNALIRLLVSSLFTLLLMYASMGGMIGLPIPAFLVENPIWMGLLQLALTLPVIVLNFRFFKNGFSALFHLSPNMDSLIATGAGAAVIYGCTSILISTIQHTHSITHDLYFESAAMILTLVSLGKMLEGRAKDKAAESIRALSLLSPKYACVIRENKEQTIPASEVLVGDIVVIRAGEMIPVDGEVIEGSGSVDESSVTGESIPVDKKEGEMIRAACLLCDGYLRLRATAVGEDTSLSRIIRLLEDAAASKAPIARIADRVSAVFVPVVMGISLLTFVVWMLLTQSLSESFRSAVSVLVISCPCALGLATPTAITVGIGRGAKNGILFRSAQALEELGSVETVVFDKTGTLTCGSPVLTDVYAYGYEASELLFYASSVEALSSHPLARAIVDGAKRAEIEDLAQVKEFSYKIGVGAVGEIDGHVWHIGKPEIREEKEENSIENAEASEKNGIRFLKRASKECLARDLFVLEREGKTAVVVSVDSVAVGVLGISDDVREGTNIAVEALKSADVRCLMLTGDNERVAASVAKKTSVDGFYASLLPEDKERMVKEISKNGKCAMVGDGINDAPALVRADVGIAVGAGTEVAIDCADVVISDFSAKGVAQAYLLSRATMRVIKQNLFWALFYNAICIPVAAGVFYPLLGWQLSPMLASAAMSFSSVFVVTNALRLRTVRLGDLEKKPEKKVETEMKEYRFSVTGMMCPRCVAHVKEALEAVNGVEGATVDLASESATVICQSFVEEKKLKSAIVAAGYGVK